MLASLTISSMPLGYNMKAASLPANVADGAVTFLFEPEEVPLLAYLNEDTEVGLLVSDRRLVWTTRRGGMLGKRFETFSVRLAHIIAFTTAGPGGMMGDSEVQLLLVGGSGISTGFVPGTDIAPLITHLTAHAGV